ncbi:type II secretion system F family protein [Aliivibrio wodanis]|uniref:type II secretion system F family protein n=1 Tax=Aliivibrio wodanis TaxID=80852 RepID=UPI00406D2875
MFDINRFIFTALFSTGFMLVIYLGITRLVRTKQLTLLTEVKKKGREKTFITHWLKEKTVILSSNDVDIKKKLQQAGFLNTQYSHLIMPMKYAVVVLGELMVAGLYFHSYINLTYWVIISALWGMVIIVFPDVYLQSKIKSRIQRVSNQMPYLIDLMAVCVQTGMTIEASLTYLAKEMEGFDKDLMLVLNKMNERSRVVGLEAGLEEMYQQVPSNEMRSFVMTLTQSMHHGSSIYSVLTTLASDIREVQMLELEERIGKLAAKMSVPLIVFIMIPIVILIAAPGVMRLMLNA